MIRVTYKTTEKGIKVPEETLIRIFPGRMFVSYNIKDKAKTTVEQMRKDGKKGVLFSRGCLIQNFAGKSESEILEIAKIDIVKGVEVAKEKTGKVLKIIDLVVEEK